MRLILLALAALLVSPPAAPAAAGWARPVEGRVLRAFALGADRFAAGQHRGVDLAAAHGSPVRSACSGRVSFAGRVPGGGLTVSVRCGRLVATYQQLAAAGVRSGTGVAAGTRLGSVGRSGDPRTSRPHVHLGVREAATGRYLDPLTLLARAPPRFVPPLPLARDPRSPRLGRAPAPRSLPRSVRARRPARAPLRAWPRPPRALLSPGRPVAETRLPWTVWAGLAGVGFALPLGGFVRLRRRRRATAAVARTA